MKKTILLVLVLLTSVSLTGTAAAQNADLAITNLTVAPSTVTTRSFTSCSFNITNNGPTALSSEYLNVDYYLSSNTTFGDGDDVKIGDTGFALSIASGVTYLISLSSTGLANMVRFWPSDQLCGNYYVFAKITISFPPPTDNNSGNNYDRTDSTINYTGCPPPPIIKPPTVRAVGAMLVKEKSAWLQGTIVDDGGTDCDVQIRYKPEGGSYSYTDWLGATLRTGQFFSQSVYGLTPGTKYYYAVQGRNSAGEGEWSNEPNFTTLGQTSAINLKKFEINQCFQEVEEDLTTHELTKQKYALIETKPFVVRVTLENSSDSEANVEVSLQICKTGQNTTVVNPLPVQSDSISKNYGTKTFTFRYLDAESNKLTAGQYDFKILVRDSNKNVVLDKTLDKPYTFCSSKPIRILVQPVTYKGTTAPWDPLYLYFTERVFPVPMRDPKLGGVNRFQVAKVFSALEFNPLLCHLFGVEENCLFDKLDVILNDYNYGLQDYVKADLILAIVPDGFYTDGSAGGQRGKSVIAMVHQSIQHIVAHEIGHVYGLGEEYVKSEYKRCDSTSLWVLHQWFEFDKNPPPLFEFPLGEYQVVYPGSPVGRFLDVPDPDSIFHSPFNKIFKDDKGNQLKDLWGNPVCYMKCSGNLVQDGAYDIQNENNGRIKPSTHATMMSTASPGSFYWISCPEYKSLICDLVGQNCSTICNAALPVRFLASSPAPRIRASGSMNVVDKAGRLNPIVPSGNLDLTPQAVDPNYRLVFRSPQGVVLDTFNFEPTKSEYYDPCNMPFSLVVDIPTDSSTIQLVVEGQVADELIHSAASPIIQVVSPNGGESATGDMLVTWSASDPDSNNLTYTVKYSWDNGNEWTLVSIDQTATELVLDTNELPGGNNCLVKVIASDGWNRAEDTSDASFSVPTKPPKVTIVYPDDGAVLIRSQGLQGRGVARDPETSEINDPNAIVWSSDKDGILGKGSLLGFELSLGSHVLTATATDPEGKTAIDQVNITVLAHPCDFNYDLRIDSLDVLILAQNWLGCSEPNQCKVTDLNHDGKTDFGDISLFAEDWRKQQLEPRGPLVAHWALDEIEGAIAHDSAGVHDANVYGAAWTSGKINGALSFDGINDYVDCGNSDILSPEFSTISFWMLPEGSNWFSYILGKTADLGYSREYTVSTDGAGKLVFYFGEDINKRVEVRSRFGIPTGQWLHVVLTRDGSKASLYINGRLDTSASYSFRPTNMGYNLRIGSVGSSDSWAGYFKGKLDDVRIYDETLTEEEIEQLCVDSNDAYLLENFETGYLGRFPWTTYTDSASNGEWDVTSDKAHTGIYSARAGTINDNEYTSLEVKIDCQDGNISFWRKVSSEQDYAELKFYIDYNRQKAWSGNLDWEKVSFPVSKGIRTFTWTYSKQVCGAESEDTAWIDDIVFP